LLLPSNKGILSSERRKSRLYSKGDGRENLKTGVDRLPRIEYEWNVSSSL
jgi:hypothetical protein